MLLLLTTGCGKVVCSYCGESKFCDEYDINGTTRYICKDCLADPNIGIYGNVVRDYSELYENGTLEYPDGTSRGMRMNSYDLFDREYGDFLVYELIPHIKEAYGLPISDSPDMHLISGSSSGGKEFP